MRPLHFFLITGSLIAALFVAQRPLPDRDLFGAIPVGRSVPFVQMTEPELYAAKFVHGRSSARHDIGLFGNSRAVMVSGVHMGRPSGGFFNYAVPGSSFRTSVALAEALAGAGKLPRTVLISLDHLEIQFDGNPNTRQVGAWLHRVWRDLAAGFRQPDIGSRAILRATWRHVYVGYGGVMRYFNAEQIKLGVRWRLGSEDARAWWRGAPRSGGSGYRHDGSRAPGKPAKAPRLGALGPTAPAILAGYFREDLRRLAALRQGGVRIIVYESPLHADSFERATRHPAPHAAAIRAILLQDCERLGLECHGQARAAALAAAPGWQDATHPPAKALGAYLAALIARRPNGRSGAPRAAEPAR